MSLEEIRTETQIKLKNMAVQHRTGKWEWMIYCVLLAWWRIMNH